MANRNLFKSIVGSLVPKSNTANCAGGKAYQFNKQHALAQYAATGCLNSTFYTRAEDQLEKVLGLCEDVEAKFVGKTAIYCREAGYMKDMPALLCAWLSAHDRNVLAQVFPRVIDSPKMLLNFVQIVRSGAVGRKSFGSMPRRLIRDWLDSRSDDQLFNGSIGSNPSMADVIKMVHPKPQSLSRGALYGYLIGRDVDERMLSEKIRHYESYKAGQTNMVPNVPFQMLSSLPLGKREWIGIAQNGSWQMTRMNLNTFARHGVFEDKEMIELIAARLGNAEAIKRARVFPYQLMMAYKMASEKVPAQVQDALQDAMEIAMANVPQIKGQIYVCPDVSGSMTWASATGYRNGATSQVRCIDVAALFTASLVRKNRHAHVIPFEQSVVNIQLNSRDSVMTNAEKLAKIGGGGTNCSAPLAMLNRQNAKGDMVIFVSDNESWVDPQTNRGTELMRQWSMFKKRNPNAKLVCVDIQPNGSTQAVERADILNVGGFSDRVFDIIAAYAQDRLCADHWVGEIEKVNFSEKVA